MEVWADWEGLSHPAKIGTLEATASRRKEIFAFEYDPAWLVSGQGRELDPRLAYFPGRQFPPSERANFGIFLDSAPDRWGRVLMDRREAQEARDAGRPERKLRESDYLIGVDDAQRMGALRFRLTPDGPFLDDRELASPPWTSLRELEQASLEIDRAGSEKKAEYRRWLKLLIAPGGSLGGARPKAGVLDPENQLWIAKFPSRQDSFDRGLWEQLLMQLAAEAGITVAPSLARKFNVRHHTFLTRRFDRAASGQRIHFASAMTLLGRNDGDDASTGVSYLHLAELLLRQGARPDQDLEELWRRIVFFMCVSNADDHLRNHGFLQSERGWLLSPAYDMNPDPDADGLKLNVSETDNAQDLKLALEVAPFFRLKPERAHEVLNRVASAVRGWNKMARAMKISSCEQAIVAPAFRVTR